MEPGTAEPAMGTQIYTTFSATLGALAMGTILGYSSPAGPILLSERSSLTVTEAQNNWIGSIITIGACVGCPIGGYAMRKLGRKATMIYSVGPYAAGWILIASAQTFAMLLVGRFIGGLCLGITSVVVPTFIGEFASAEIRGLLSSCFQLMLILGIIMSYSLGLVFESFRWIAVCCAIPAILHSVCIFFVKESPTYLLVESRRDEAKASLQFYRGKKYDTTKELESMMTTVRESTTSSTTLWDFRKPYLLKPLLIAIFLHVFQQCSGIDPALFNLAIVFKDAGSSLSSNVSSLIVGMVLFLGSAVSIFLIERLGRKLLLIISSSIMAISLFPLGAHFFLKESTGGEATELAHLNNSYGWVPLASLMVFVAGFSLGYGPIPWILMSEMFSSDARDIASSMASISNWTTAFVITITFGPLKEAIGPYGTYWLYAAICGASIPFCIFIVPETKGRKIEDIVSQFGCPLREDSRA